MRLLFCPSPEVILLHIDVDIRTSPRRVRPHEEAPLARRTAILALGFFVAASLALAVLGVDIGTLQRTFPLYALGGFSILIFGTSRLLIAGMAGRDIAGGTRSALATAIPAALGAAGLFAAYDAQVLARFVFALAWSAGATAHVITTLATVRRRPTRPPVPNPTATSRTRVPIHILEAASLLYAAAAAIMLPLAVLDHVAYPVLIHVVLVGFVVVTIMGVAAHILPRFTRAPIPTSLLAWLVPFAIGGPALLALGLAGQRSLLALGALVEGAAFALFAAAIALTLGRANRWRVPNLAYATAPLAIAIGGLIALAYATTGRLAAHLAVHAILVVFGFVGLFVVAASTDLYAPALRPGATPAKQHAAIVVSAAIGALAVTAFGAWANARALAQTGMLAYAGAILWQLIGIISSHRRAGRVLAKFLAAK